MNRGILAAVAAMAVGAVALGIYSSSGSEVGGRPAEAWAAETPGVVKVYKTPTCGCCNGWVDHLREEGFTVETVDLPNLGQVKEDLGVDTSLMSCHTALVDGYVVEGHVPASAIRRLLAERPEVTGLAVPGMPMGSPGMEGPNPEVYQVLTFQRGGGTAVFETVQGLERRGGDGD
jgi:hypothetical protein